jgi:hypothetical protein
MVWTTTGRVVASMAYTEVGTYLAVGELVGEAMSKMSAIVNRHHPVAVDHDDSIP